MLNLEKSSFAMVLFCPLFNRPFYFFFSVKSKVLYEGEVTLFDLLLIRGITKSRSDSDNEDHRIESRKEISELSESLEDFLEKLNRDRAVNDVVKSAQQKSLELSDSSFFVEVETG
jgi:hypothetical protein